MRKVDDQKDNDELTKVENAYKIVRSGVLVERDDKGGR